MAYQGFSARALLTCVSCWCGWQYQSQIHDLLAMRLNVVSVPPAAGVAAQKKTVFDVDVNEPFFGGNARLEFPKVAGASLMLRSG
jgi:hypothetical protein